MGEVQFSSWGCSSASSAPRGGRNSATAGDPSIVGQIAHESGFAEKKILFSRFSTHTLRAVSPIDTGGQNSHLARSLTSLIPRQTVTIFRTLEDMAEDSEGAFVLAKLNVETHPELAKQLGVQSLPTVTLYRDGEVIDSFTGQLPKMHIRSFLKRNMTD